MIPRRLRRFWALVPIAVMGGAMAAGCGADNSLVGGSCGSPFTQCGVSCVDLENDPGNCGACALACPSGVSCIMGQCATGSIDGSTDAAARDAGIASDGAIRTDATMPEDAPSGDSSDTGGAPTDSGPDRSAPDGSAPDAAPADGAPSDSAPTDGPAADATTADGTAPDAAPPDSATDGAVADSTTGDSAPAEDGADSACVVPFDTPAQCGDCTTACGDAAPFCAPNGSTFACVPSCAPLEDCEGTCVDETSDALNCGGCGIVCPSQICVASKCVGSTAGSVVFIGHDYATTMTGTAQARVLSNAVFLWPTDPVHVLSYERYADASALAHIHAIVTAGATGLGRTADITSTDTDSDIPDTLDIQTYGVLLVPDQVNAQGVDLGALGSSWGPTLATFTQSGGIVVILDGGTGAGGMPSLATGTGLLDVTAQSSLVTGTALYILAPTDSLSVGVVNPYAAGASSVTVTTEPNQGSVDYVIAPAVDGGAPVAPTVVHKVF